MKKTCDFSGFTFTGTDGKTYGYDANGAPCTTSGVSATNIADVSADRWGRIANTPISTPSMMPQPPMIQNNTVLPIGMSATSFQPMPNISLAQPQTPSPFYTDSISQNNAIKISKAPHNYSGASQKEIDKHFAIAYDNSNGRLDINGFCNSGNQAIARCVDHLRDQAVQKDNTNGTGHKVLAHKHTLNFSFNLMNDEQMNNLTDFLKWQNLDLKVLNLSSNNITFSSIEPLFYNLQVKPDHLPHSHLRTHNIQYINLSNNQIGDYGANYIAESLKSGRYPATKHIDVSGNNITDVGKEKLVTTVNEALNPNLAITLEKHNDTSGVWNFIKKAFNYYAEEHSKKLAENGKATLAVYGDNDWANCKKLIHDASKEMSMGVVKHSSNIIAQQLVQKAPPQVKGATVGAIFVAAGIDTALAVDVENLGYCIAAINKEVASRLNLGFDPNLPENSVGFIGQNGEIVDGWH